MLFEPPAPSGIPSLIGCDMLRVALCVSFQKGLWDQEVFDFTTTREYDDVVAEAKKKGEKIHMARVHGLIYEKNYQLKEDDLARKLRFRRVSN